MTSNDGSKTDKIVTLRVNLDQLKPFLARLGVTVVDDDEVFNSDGTFKDPEADRLMRGGFTAVHGEMKATPRPLLEHWLASDYRLHMTDPARHPFKVDKADIANVPDERRFGHVVIARDVENMDDLAEKLRDVMIINAVHVYDDRYELWGLSPKFQPWCASAGPTPKYKAALACGTVILSEIDERPDLATFIASPRVHRIDENGVPIDTVIPESNQVGRILMNRALIAEPKFWTAIHNHAVIYRSDAYSAEILTLSLKSPQFKPCTGKPLMYECTVMNNGEELIFTPRGD